MLKKGLKKTTYILLSLLFLFILFNFDLLLYAIAQGKGQLKIITEAETIDEALINRTYPDSLVQKLKLIQAIKKHSVDSIGLKHSNNYSTIYNQKGKPVLYTVSACKSYSFEEKYWNFSFLGKMPYKGFFDKNKADNEAKELEKSGYDVDIYSPSGWSTLGWFTDPILSNMLYGNEAQLANLLFHELTHSTLFVKNNVTFNENLANFIAEKATMNYLQNRYGINSKELSEYQYSIRDGKIFNAYILSGKSKLDSLYNSFGNLQEQEKKARKAELINSILKGVSYLPLHNKSNYVTYSKQALKSGNAFFMSFDRYDSQQELFEKEFNEQFNANLLEYLSYLKAKYPSL